MTKKQWHMIHITFLSGKTITLSEDEFERIGDEWEHKKENIILNITKPLSSFIYETDYRGEMLNKEYIKYKVI